MIPEKHPLSIVLTDRDMSILIYREYKIRRNILSKKTLRSEQVEWTKKVNRFVVLFNYLNKENEYKLTQLEQFPQKGDIRSLLEYVKNEVVIRQKMYPKWVRQGKLKYDVADYKLQGMKAVYNKLIDIRNDVHGVQQHLF